MCTELAPVWWLCIGAREAPLTFFTCVVGLLPVRVERRLLVRRRHGDDGGAARGRHGDGGAAGRGHGDRLAARRGHGDGAAAAAGLVRGRDVPARGLLCHLGTEKRTSIEFKSSCELNRTFRAIMVLLSVKM